MSANPITGGKIDDLFWGPFAELRSVEGTVIEEMRPYEQVKTIILEALFSSMEKISIPRLLALAAQTKGPILYLGCGANVALMSLAENGYEVVGLDKSPEVIESARRRLVTLPEEAQDRVKLVQTDLTQFDLGEAFPLVISSFFTVLDEQREPAAVLRQAVRHLAPNGIMAVDYPVYKPPQSGTGTIMDVDMCVKGRNVGGKIGWKLSEDSKRLIVNCSVNIPQMDGTTRCFLEAMQIDLVSHSEVDDLLSEVGLVMIERQCDMEAGVDTEYHLLRCRRRADVSYPLWHPFLPMNGLEQQVIMLVEGKGCKVRDKQGREYIDASGGLWNTYCGLGEPEIIQAITDQLHRLSSASLFARRGNEPALKLARELVDMAPSPLQWVYLTGSGSESVELGIKIARIYNTLQGRENKEIVYLDESYHGTFFGSMSVSGLTLSRERVAPLLPGVSPIPTPNSLRCPAEISYVDFAVCCAQALEERAINGDVAAFILEPVLGSAGVVIPPPEYFQHIEQICRKYNILLILDEVATGFGRTGRWFAAEHYNLRPDILLLSKGMNSGYLPIGAVLFSAEIGEALMKRVSSLFHGSTYNGHPACCAAALANISLIRRKGLVARAAKYGRYFHDRLTEMRNISSVKEIRSMGLMLSVVLKQEDGTPATGMQIFQVSTALRQMGILCHLGLSSLTFAPALVISRDEINAIVQALQTVLASVRLRNGEAESV
jgi:adenosylmethionine-8-amino-7-oxononanoate aminotransferase/2-polyprenyl-3-methyl-5-hydroxy-6-metoxy-1,4-benzoquinol methylase